MDSTHFPNVAKMLKIVQTNTEKNPNISFDDHLKNHLKAKKYHPMLQVKKVFKCDKLVLLHNTYKRTNVEHFKELYEEARSVIIDITKPTGENIVVSLADKIPESLTPEQYRKKAKDTDLIEKAYEGTMIFIYNHEEEWFFGTSTIPDIDCSRYRHPTKTHGEMFDEAIGMSRKDFTASLSPEKTYGFLLVHHQNVSVMDYTEELGENYAEIFHIFSRDKATKGAHTDYTDELKELPVKYADVLALEECTDEVFADKGTYGFIVRTNDGDIYRVCRAEVFDTETKNRGNSNIWYNLLDVYMKGDKNYMIKDYIAKHCPDKMESLTMTDDVGRTYEPTYLIHEVMRNMCETMYGMYRTTTYYNKYTGRYSINKEIDSTLAPIIRFHLSQLRSIQITTHTEAPITPALIRNYICQQQTIKNVRLLISHFAKLYTSQEHSKKYKSTMCFAFLNTLLTN